MTDSLRDKLYAAIRDIAEAGEAVSLTPGAVALLADMLRGPRGPLHDGHDLAAQILKIHGTDRYPHPNDNALKLGEEVGELMGAILKRAVAGNLDQVRKEYGDVGITLFELGNKLGIDLITCMRKVVENETRTFGLAVTRP
jgi:NTP pyrophosphatase (non-canonical NTP hydrolase)